MAKKQTVFTPPTLEQVREYKQEANLTYLKADTFYEYFTLAGWIDSKGNKVQNWKNKAITWHLAEQKKAERDGVRSAIIKREELVRKEKIEHSKPLPRDLTQDLFNMPKEPQAKPMWQQKKELLKPDFYNKPVNKNRDIEKEKRALLAMKGIEDGKD